MLAFVLLFCSSFLFIPKPTNKMVSLKLEAHSQRLFIGQMFYCWVLLFTFLSLLPISIEQQQQLDYVNQLDFDNPQASNIRAKRQFSRYICGIPPYLFHSDWPCQIWGLCINHGFTTNLPCASNQTCLERNPNTECVQGTCCTLPVVMPISSTAASLPWWWSSTPAGSGKSQAADGPTTTSLALIPLITFLSTAFLLIDRFALL